jgi:nucleotide-binding universal stress UspA family protein
MLPSRHILFPTDLSERSEKAFRLAGLMALEGNARLTILHVLAPSIEENVGQGMPPMPAPHESPWEQLHRLRMPYAHILVEHLLTEGDTAAIILQVAREQKCDTIVMGTDGHTRHRPMQMGSLAAEVVRNAPCPVVVVKMPLEDRHAPSATS